MLEHKLFGSARTWRRQLRPMVLAVFSYRYDVELVPALLANIEPIVDGWVAFDDRASGDLFSNEPSRRRLLVERAKELGATWVLAVDPDERVERGAATRLRGLTGERGRIIWEFNLREMFTADTYRVDGIWGSKMQGRLFPVFDGPLCSDQELHGAWCVVRAGYSVRPAGLNLYHLKMLSSKRRHARRDLYEHLDPIHGYQAAGYDYLVDETNAEFERILASRDFFPAHHEADASNLYMVNVRAGDDALVVGTAAAREPHAGTPDVDSPGCEMTASQLGQLRITVGDQVRRDSMLAVVVIGLRAPNSLFNAVRSLVQQDTPSEIIVVNSGGGDLVTVLGEYLRSVILVELREPVFVGAARNLGIQASHAPFIAFLAGDCVAAPGWVAERTNAHINGEGAVASLVENDRPRNPFAWAAHLGTYGHRMAGNGGKDSVYGASYDRELFSKYGYFSETRIIGEDSDFHSRFRPADPIYLHDSIKTIHCNPEGPASYLKDQFQRGSRGRYLADFFDIEYNLGFIFRETVRRVTRIVRLSATRLRGKERLSAIASWPLLPLGALFYFAGMAAHYVKANAAQRLFRQGMEMALFGRTDIANGLLRKAIELRPVTARFHLALAKLLKQRGEDSESARQFFASWDIDRKRAIDASDRDGLPDPATARGPTSIGLQLVVIPDSSDRQLAEFIAAVTAQKTGFSNLDVLVVEGPDISSVGARLRKSHENFVKFVPRHEILHELSGGNSRRGLPNRSFVVVSSCCCVIPPDWLDVLRAYIIAYPEIELFHGSCRPYRERRASFMTRLGVNFGLFPRVADNGGLLCFAHPVNWACDKSLLSRSGGLVHENVDLLGNLTLTERVLKAGASGLYAPEWHARFRVEATLTRLLRAFYRDGYYAAKHVVVTKDIDILANVFSTGGLHGSVGAAWRFAVSNVNVWRKADRRSFLYAPIFLFLFAVGYARQVGWMAGLKRFGGQVFGPIK